MNFKILTGPSNVRVIAKGRGIRSLKRLNSWYGKGNWRKLAGDARIEWEDGTVEDVELHWYEAHGIGPKEFKVSP